MRFLDKESIGIKFYHQPTSETLFFKAYLEKSDIEYKIEEHVLPNLQVGSGYSHLTLRTLNNITVEFNVFSEDLEEAVENYEKLHLLISFMKGDVLYSSVNKSITFDVAKNDPRSKLFFCFKGMPRILNNKILEKDSLTGFYDETSNPELTIDDIPIQIYNFSYTINKEMGYIQTPSNFKDRDSGKLFAESMSLIPIAYKISLVFRVAADAEYLNDISYEKDIDIRAVLPNLRRKHKESLKGKPYHANPSPVSSRSSVSVITAPQKITGKAAVKSPEAAEPQIINESGFKFIDSEESFNALPLTTKRLAVNVLKAGLGANSNLDKLYTKSSNKASIIDTTKNIMNIYTSLTDSLQSGETIEELFVRDASKKSEIDALLNLEIQKIRKLIVFGAGN